MKMKKMAFLYIYRTNCMCKTCGAQLEFEGDRCIDCYTIEQAEEDKWKD